MLAVPLVKENSKPTFKGKDKKLIGHDEYTRQSKLFQNALQTDDGLKDNLKGIVGSSKNNKIISISIKDVYYKHDEKSDKLIKVTKEDYEKNYKNKAEDKKDGIIDKIVETFLPITVYATDIGNSQTSTNLYSKLTFTTSVTCDLSSGSSRIFWGQSNATWSSMPSKFSTSSRDLISIGCDNSSWHPTNNAISVFGSTGTTSWSNPVIAGSNGNSLMWSFYQTVYGGSGLYAYLTGIYAGCNYAYGSDGYATFNSNYTHSYNSAQLSPSLGYNTASITITNTGNCDTVGNYVTCFLTTYYRT